MAGPEQETPAAPSRRDEGWFRRRLEPIRRARDRVRRLPGGWVVWRVSVALVGLIVVVAGIILLPLPGPGWLIVFAGIAIWATEFAWARATAHLDEAAGARLLGADQVLVAPPQGAPVGWPTLEDRNSNSGRGD